MNLHKDLTAQETTALAEGVISVLRRLIRPLIGSMSLARLQELLRIVFVEEAERRLREEFAGRSVPVSQLALLTGMDTRQLNKLKAHPGFGRDLDSRDRFESSMTPSTHLLDVWSTDPSYLDPDSGQPIVLPVTGEAPSLEALMKASRFIRGVTARSVADRLVLSGAATEGRDGRLRMVTEKFLPSQTGDVEGAIEVGFHAIGRLVDTVITNLETLDTDQPRLYQRAYWTNRLAPHQQEAFRERLTGLLSEMEERGTAMIADMEMKIESPSQVSGGFGLYYFEDDPSESSNR